VSFRQGLRRFSHNARMTWATFRADLGLGMPAPDSDFWFHKPGFRTSAGTYVSPETAMRLATVFACDRVVTETIGSLPTAIMHWKKSGAKERADQHPVADLLRVPNPWQTGFEFWEMVQHHLDLRGNSFVRKVSSNSRAIDQLIPLHPDRVRVFRLPNNRLRYEVTNNYGGGTEQYTQDEIIHFRGLSSDGIMGLSIITAMSEVIGTALARQEYGARFFSNNAKPGVWVKTAVKLNPEAQEKFEKTFSEGFTGANAFKTAIMPPGFEIVSLGLTNKDSQLLELNNSTRIDICGAWRVPPHKVGDLSRGTFSNIEQQNIEFATDGIRPRVVRLERRFGLDILDSLGIGEPGEFFLDFSMDALFRGDMKSRYDAYNQALQYWLTVNEVRAAENLNPVEGGDVIMRPVNMQPADQDEDDEDAPEDEKNAATGGGSAETPDDEEENEQAAAREAHLSGIVMRSAARIVRREVKELRKLQSRGLDGFHLEKATAMVYEDLASLLEENLLLPAEAAQQYCRQRQEGLRMKGAAEIDWIEEHGPRLLADLALRGPVTPILQLGGAAI
jgi:HK97 family phage portal protein